MAEDKRALPAKRETIESCWVRTVLPRGGPAAHILMKSAGSTREFPVLALGLARATQPVISAKRYPPARARVQTQDKASLQLLCGRGRDRNPIARDRAMGPR